MTETEEPLKRLPPESGKIMSEWTNALASIETKLPDRVTLRQMVFFSAMARSILRGHTVTQQSIFDEFRANLGRSLTKSGALFFEPTRTYPEALGWLRLVENPDDRREKFVELTERGRAALAVIIDIIKRLKAS